MLAWFRDSKTASEHQYAERFITLIDWGGPESTVPSPDVLVELTKARPGPRRLRECLPGASYHKIAKALNLLDVEEMEVHHLQPTLLESYTAHSVKRGALQHLWKIQPEHDLDLAKIQMLGSHKAESGNVVTETAVRYAGAMMQIARTLGSQVLTRLL